MNECSDILSAFNSAGDFVDKVGYSIVDVFTVFVISFKQKIMFVIKKILTDDNYSLC